MALSFLAFGSVSQEITEHGALPGHVLCTHAPLSDSLPSVSPIDTVQQNRKPAAGPSQA